MLANPRLERIYEGVELVDGIGHPTARRMCIMSFVACLAGEGRTDAPITASPVIRSFAIVVNDRMPPSVRQRLKPFAPRIIRTNDGRDEIRTDILRQALAAEILPKVLSRDRSPAPATPRHGVLWRAWARLFRASLRRQIIDLMDEEAYGHCPALGTDLAYAAGHLISLCALHAEAAEDEGWYWGKSIEILDRLCSVGAEARVPDVRSDRLQWLEQIIAAPRCIANQADAEPTWPAISAIRLPGAV